MCIRARVASSRSSTRRLFQEALYFARDNQFLIGRYDHHLYPRVGDTDGRFGGPSRLVLVQVEHDAECVEVVANGAADRGSVLTNARREDQGIRAVQLQEEGTNPMSGLLYKDFQGQPCPGIPLGGLGLDVSYVIEARSEE